MRRWLWNSSARIAGLVGLLALNVLDVANNNPVLSNGFWTIGSDKAFHLALWTVGLALCFVIVRTRS